MMNKCLSEPNAEWYTYSGINDDVVVSTRIRFARNLADFPFPNNFKGDDANRIKRLVFDSFSKNSENEVYQTVSLADVNDLGGKMLNERGLISSKSITNPYVGLVMRISGTRPNSGLVCTINEVDHVRISSFVAGLDVENAYSMCKEVDEILQNSLQFAASYDFGYLTTAVKDLGSGMKISARVHLPSVVFLGRHNSLFSEIKKQGFSISASFGSTILGNTSVGDYYQICNLTSQAGSELEQMAAFVACIKNIIKQEQCFRKECLDQRSTEVHNRILRSYYISKTSLLITFREAIQLISDIKWGLNIGILSGIKDNELSALLFRIQEAHLLTVIKNGTFKFPNDIAGNDKKETERLRAIIIQDILENIFIK